MESLQSLYELDRPAIQKANTMQCWWLSMLEIARATGKLKPIFEKGGVLYNTPVPAEGGMPAKTIYKVEEKNRKLEVYGPEWQRMIMSFLLACRWHLKSDTVNSSDRAEALTNMLGFLDVKGITLGEPLSLTQFNVSDRVNQLSDGQRVIVDKIGHAMSGIVEFVQPEDPSKKGYNRIRVFNQQRNQTGEQVTFMCWVKKDKTDGKNKLLSTTGTWELNWILPVTIEK